MKVAEKGLVLVVLLTVVFVLSGLSLAQEGKKVNINIATLEELAELKGIGPTYAQRIIDFREKNGPFEKVEDLMKIQGIGEKTLEANQDRLAVE